MSFTPDDSAIRITPDIQKALENCSQNEIVGIMRDAMLSQNLVTADPLNETWFNETPLATAPRSYAKTIVIDGVKHVLEASSEADLLKNENALLRQTFAPESATPQSRDTQPRDTQSGRFVERLQEAVEEVQNSRVVQSWEQATQEFKNSPAGSDWPGGDENTKIIGNQLIEQGLVDSPDKTAALVAAYRYCRENNLLVENEQVTEANSLADEISKCQRPEDLRALFVRRRGGDMGSFVG